MARYLCRADKKSWRLCHGIWYDIVMTTKEIALKTIQELPEKATWEDIQERINFIAAVGKGLEELDAGKGVPHETVRQEFAEWLTR
jgi:predicted transcriptional regulator